MMNKNERKISVHLEEYDNERLKNLSFDQNIINEMEITREVCSTISSIRKEYDIRVRLPLKSATIYTKINIKPFFLDIIKSETNIKEIHIKKTEFEEIAEKDLKLNPKEIGLRLRDKLKIILEDLKLKKWKELSENKIEISGEILNENEFEYIYKTKNLNSPIKGCQNNKILISLDISIDAELEKEGFVKDLIRKIQILRKEKGLILTDKINLEIETQNNNLEEYIEKYLGFIKNQTLTNNIKFINIDSTGGKEEYVISIIS